ncbi:MAG: hypothetical protein OSJ39_03980 [Clostridia bacterium]|nr:hypothetical protein [Clostridia bacterium]
MKPIDFDGLFDQKLAKYLKENAGKFTEKQWEDKIPLLYQKFGDTYLKSIGFTPREYYKRMSDKELVDTLLAHIKEEVPVSDFLCRELESRDCPEEILPLLECKDEQLLMLAVNLAGANPIAFDAYFALLKGEADREIKDAVVDQLKVNADAAKARALAFLNEGIEKELMLEVLSRVRERDETVYEVLLNAFREGEDLPMHASYLAAYGDSRALPVLLERIAGEDINFLEFRELKYAIEALGGEYTEERDFSGDPYYAEFLSEQQFIQESLQEKKH